MIYRMTAALLSLAGLFVSAYLYLLQTGEDRNAGLRDRGLRDRTAQLVEQVRRH